MNTSTSAGTRIPGQLAADKYTTETITWIAQVSDHLFRFRITRFRGFRFVAGQFARLGIFRDDGPLGPRYVWRAYSIASATYDDHLEFYSIVVPGGEFTTRLAQLKVGDTVLVEKTNYGFLTSDRFEGGHDLWLLASGTGIAPFMAVLYDPDTWQRYEKIVVVHSVRQTHELAYREDIAALREHPIFGEHFHADPGRLSYVPIVTREPAPGMLDERMTAAIANGKLEEKAGVKLDQTRARIMICGNPEMVDDVRRALRERGYTTARRGKPGNIAVENYW